jgi:hypothetical protein
MNTFFSDLFPSERDENQNPQEASIVAFLDEQNQLLSIDRAVRWAISNNNLEELAVIFDKVIGGTMREIKENEGFFSPEITKNHLYEQENNCIQQIRNFCNMNGTAFPSSRKKLWIEVALEQGNLEILALFFVYQWHRGENCENRLLSLKNLAYQYEKKKIFEFILRLFFSEQKGKGENEVEKYFKNVLNYFPIYVKEGISSISRNINCAKKIVQKFQENEQGNSFYL